MSTELAVADRAAVEPRGRWENRCDYGKDMGVMRWFCCDRTEGHSGLHAGRLWDVSKSEPMVIGYLRR